MCRCGKAKACPIVANALTIVPGELDSGFWIPDNHFSVVWTIQRSEIRSGIQDLKLLVPGKTLILLNLSPHPDPLPKELVYAHK
jgi:hypothetical protein